MYAHLELNSPNWYSFVKPLYLSIYYTRMICKCLYDDAQLCSTKKTWCSSSSFCYPLFCYRHPLHLYSLHSRNLMFCFKFCITISYLCNVVIYMRMCYIYRIKCECHHKFKIGKSDGLTRMQPYVYNIYTLSIRYGTPTHIIARVYWGTFNT